MYCCLFMPPGIRRGQNFGPFSQMARGIILRYQGFAKSKMIMSVFECVMLVCFGASWPVSVAKTIKAKNPTGKSIGFLYLVFIGYVSGCLHKYYYSWDSLIWLYVFNGVMVATDIILTHYYLAKLRKKSAT